MIDLHELSRKVLSKYTNLAVDDLYRNSVAAGREEVEKGTCSAPSEKKIAKRQKGIKKAVNKMASPKVKVEEREIATKKTITYVDAEGENT